MRCPFCGKDNTRVIDSRPAEDGNAIRRRRECNSCGKRFTTYETVETTPILVVKADGSRQQFDVNKIKNGMIKACEKRPVSISQIEEVALDIEKTLQNNFSQEVPSSKIGQMVMDALKKLDEVAYVRFASVYRQFKDIDSFKKLLEEL